VSLEVRPYLGRQSSPGHVLHRGSRAAPKHLRPARELLAEAANRCVRWRPWCWLFRSECHRGYQFPTHIQESGRLHPIRQHWQVTIRTQHQSARRRARNIEIAEYGQRGLLLSLSRSPRHAVANHRCCWFAS